MKKLFTLITFVLLGLVTANAQSKIPGSLDLSTTVVEAGTGTLHEGAGWDGSKIDWMTKGNTATIPFENTKDGAKYKIISYGGTNQSQVVVSFSILDSKGDLIYDQTTEPYAAGGFGDKKKNTSLPFTDALAAGNYSLVLYYDNLEEGASLEVNICQIDFIDAEEYTEDTPTGPASMEIPGILDGKKAVITKNCSWGSTPSCDDNNCFNWVGDGDVVTYSIINNKEAAYAISFDTATPCEPVTIDFLITDANGKTVYGQTAKVVCTGENGGDWAFKPEGHNTSLPNTAVLPKGNYTVALTFHQGTNYENFTTNLKDLTFAAIANGIELDMTKTTVEAGTTEIHGSAGWNGTNIDWMQNGNIAKIPFTVSKEGVYQIMFTAATICDEANVITQIIDANGQEVYNQKCVFENNGSFSDFIENKTLPVTPTLSAGNYTMVLTYGQAMYGGEPTSVTVNIASITLLPAGGSSDDPTVDQKTLYSWTGGEAGATEQGGKATAADGESVNYANSGYYTMRLNGKKDAVDTEKYVEVTLDEALQSGDQIIITAYRNKDTDAKSSVYFKFENGTIVDDEYIFPNIHADYGGVPSPHTWTVADAAGSKSFRMTRGLSGTNVFITKIEIVRGGNTTAVESVKSVKNTTGYIYNLAGQRVDANYKGIVIINGKKIFRK